MHFDKDSIQKLSKLCRIECSEEETQKLEANLESILSYMDQLNQVNTEAVKETSSMTKGLELLFHEDEVGEVIAHETFMKNTPDKVGGMVKIPTVI
jgi:aspartyl-tRNA(Asn)/glutamyl-tRNA(Gln) amidotransferase subunit C